MESLKYILELHSEHGTWLELLEFCSDEIQSFTNRISDLNKLDPEPVIAEKIEQFQIQFNLQNEHINLLKHDVKKSENSLQEKIVLNDRSVDHKRILDEPKLRERVEVFDKSFTNLKTNFKKFVGSSIAG